MCAIDVCPSGGARITGLEPADVSHPFPVTHTDSLIETREGALSEGRMLQNQYCLPHAPSQQKSLVRWRISCPCSNVREEGEGGRL